MLFKPRLRDNKKCLSTVTYFSDIYIVLIGEEKELLCLSESGEYLEMVWPSLLFTEQAVTSFQLTGSYKCY